MHGRLLLVGLGVALLLRWGLICLRPSLGAQTWAQRWQWALSLFWMPPLFLGMTAIAVLKMGHHGSMLGQSVGWLGCHSVAALGAIALGLLLLQAGQTWHTVAQIRRLPLQPVQGIASRQIESTVPFAARVGFWQPDLVVSPALTQQLSPDELRAVLLHEQAHLQFRDTFWFFWLGWLRRCTRWLPQTEALWQELLLLREIRADRWAAQFADPLVIAEALLKMTQAAAVPLWPGAAFTEVDTETRLEARIRALLSVQADAVSPSCPSVAIAPGPSGLPTNPPPMLPSDPPSMTLLHTSFLNSGWMAAGLLLSLLPLLSSLYHSAG